jgi:hypothetical protein
VCGPIDIQTNCRRNCASDTLRVARAVKVTGMR